MRKFYLTKDEVRFLTHLLDRADIYEVVIKEEGTLPKGKKIYTRLVKKLYKSCPPFRAGFPTDLFYEYG